MDPQTHPLRTDVTSRVRATRTRHRRDGGHGRGPVRCRSPCRTEGRRQLQRRPSVRAPRPIRSARRPGARTSTSEFGTLISDQLLNIDQKNALVPRLAESFTTESGATKWVFKLRKGVTFLNGKTMTADDVVASINMHRGPDTKSGSKAGLQIVDDIKADGDNVIFTLKSGSADFGYEVASYRLSIFPSKDGVVDWQSGGCGAFKVTTFDPGVTIQATRNTDYWDAANVYFDEVEALVVSDPVARSNALVSNAVHYIDRCDLKTIGLLQAKPRHRDRQRHRLFHLVATINTAIAPFDNPNVRMALKYAFDREELLKKVLLGFGTVGNDNPFAPTIKYAIDPEPRHRFDPAKAKEYLAKAGLDSLKIDLSTSDAAFAGALDAAQLMKASAAQAGIEINIVSEAADSYWDVVWMKKPFMLSYWGGRSAIDTMATQAYAADAAWNDTFWKHPRFNELLVAARAETDEAKRGAMYAEMQQLFA
ncbi:MAG: ABC transporter substrate-binding protein [Hyphomicrobiaceae bacterium]